MTPAYIGYAAMLEQFGPVEVTDYTVQAEWANIQGVMAADHSQQRVRVCQHDVGRNQQEWIDVPGSDMLPTLVA